MANSPANGRLQMLLLSCLGLGLLGLLWGCVADPGYPPPGVYAASGPVYGVASPYYDGDPFWNGWGGGYYGGFYGQGFGGTRLYRGGGGRGAFRGGGGHGAGGGHPVR